MLKSFRENGMIRGLWTMDRAGALALAGKAGGFLLLGAMAFALSRAAVASLAPLAIALFAAGLAAGRSTGAMVLGAMLGALNGSIESFNLSLPAGCAVALGGHLAWDVLSARIPVRGPRRDRRPWQRAPRVQARSPNRPGVLSAALAGAGVLVPGLMTARGELWGSVQALCAALVALAAAPLIEAALALHPGRRRLAPAERAGLAVLAAGCAAGLGAWSPALAAGACGLIGAACADRGGLVGAMLGCAAGLGAGDARLAILLSGCGVAAELCRGGSTAARGCAPALAALALGTLAGNPPAVSASACAGALIASALPGAWRGRLSGWAGRGEQADAAWLARHLGNQSAMRLRALGEAFGALAEKCAPAPVLPDGQALVIALRDALCEGCPGCAACWSEGDGRGARLLFELVALAAQAENGAGEPFGEGVPPEIARRCRRSRAIPEKLGKPLSEYVSRRRAALSRAGENRLVAAQLSQARRLIDAAAEREAAPVRLTRSGTARVASALERADIPAADVALATGSRRRLLIALGEGRWTPAMATAAARCAGRALGRAFAPEAIRGDTLCLSPVPRLTAAFGSAGSALDPTGESGDSRAVVRLPEGRLLVLICDGMGSGERAARESAGASALLQKLLAAGMGWRQAIDAVNAVMLGGGEEEMFSTADILLLNLFTGAAACVKLAACPTLIARSGAIIRAGRGSMPLGIVEKPRPWAARLRVRPGDYVLMATDGVMDSVDDSALEALLLDAAREGARDMDALAEAVLALATADGAARDDMTAVCVKVEGRK